MDDISDMRESSIISYDNTMMMCATCLVPKGVLYASWIETGMISPNRAKDAGENIVSFVPE